jgi:NADPH:quinone reductase-like Zn-dependent oxidoreductase
MKAIVQNSYGSPAVLELKEIDRPEIQQDDVLVRVQAAALHAGDVLCMRGVPYVARVSVGLPRPKDYVPGFDVAGYVESVGTNVTQFQPGDAVFGACGGACAEYVSTAQENLVPKPANLTLEQAAAVPTSAVAALRGLRDVGKIQPGQKVLINGASGGVGTFAVQIAKALGAEVTGVCSTRNVGLVESLGADHVIDYTQEDFTQGDERYDLILDNVANHSLSDCRRVLTPQGKHLPNSGHGGMGFIVNAFIQSAFRSQQGRPFVANPNKQDLLDLRDLIEAGKLTPVIDRTYALDKTPDAL